MSTPHQPETPVLSDQIIVVFSNDKVKHPDWVFNYGIPLDELRRISSPKPLFRPPPRRPKKEDKE